MKLAVFDIDGTLCDTNAVDDACFSAVVAEALAISVETIVWRDAPHITDRGIVDWLWRRHRERAPLEREIDALIDAFERALQTELARRSERFLEVPGAAAALAALQQSGWTVAIATGGWRRTAELKLATAGLPTDRLLATADDALDRATIFRLAQERAGDGFAATVLIGDGSWDLGTSRRLGWPFVGIAAGDHATELRALGATDVVPDYLPLARFVALMERSAAPAPA